MKYVTDLTHGSLFRTLGKKGLGCQKFYIIWHPSGYSRQINHGKLYVPKATLFTLLWSWVPKVLYNLAPKWIFQTN